jgi:hypothetical protein
MKEIKWNKTGMRMINFESQHKTFNKYVVSVSPGQSVGGGMIALIVRPYNQTDCNGSQFSFGHLRNFDLKSFTRTHYLNYFLEENKNKKIMLREFYHYSHGKRVLHGHLAEIEGNFYIIELPYGSHKDRSIMEEAINFLQ